MKQSLPVIMPSAHYKEFDRRKSNQPLGNLKKIKELAEVGETIKADKKYVRMLKILHHYLNENDLSIVGFWEVVNAN